MLTFLLVVTCLSYLTSSQHDHEEVESCNYWWPSNIMYPLVTDECYLAPLAGFSDGNSVSYMYECDHGHLSKFDSDDCSGEEEEVTFTGAVYCEWSDCSKKDNRIFVANQTCADGVDEVKGTLIPTGCYVSTDKTQIIEIQCHEDEGVDDHEDTVDNFQATYYDVSGLSWGWDADCHELEEVEDTLNATCVLSAGDDECEITSEHCEMDGDVYESPFAYEITCGSIFTSKPSIIIITLSLFLIIVSFF